MITGWLGVVTGWLQDDYRMVTVWLWGGYEVVMGWFWGGFGGYNRVVTG